MKLIGSICLFLAISFPAWAQQDVPAAEIFVGYSYLNIDTNGLSSRQSANGWQAGLSGNFTPRLAAEFDSTGAYKKIVGVSVSDYSYLGGLRVNVRPAFVHALVGGDYLRGSYSGSSAGQQGFAAEFGGGVQWRVSRSISIRTSGDYALSRHNIFGGPAATQNNFRASIGIVFGVGELRGSEGYVRADRRSPRPIAPGEESQEAILFGIAGVPASSGVRVTLVRYQSAANRAGVQIDDVVTRIDGAPMHTIKDIETAVGKNVTGSIHVEYLTKGIAAVESTVAVAPPAQKGEK